MINPDIEAPLTAIPHTLVGITAYRQIYYFLFPSEPSPEEYTAAGAAMVKKAGTKPVTWVYRPTAEIRWDEIRGVITHEPIRVR